MRVLVIPDVHLKPWMFKQAIRLMRNGIADKAVCLMDIADDFGQQHNLSLYENTYDDAIAFAKAFPDTLWCWGNHDVCYPWKKSESGYSPLAADLVCRKLYHLEMALPNREQLAFIHRIDNLLFLHGGLTKYFVDKYCADLPYEDVDAVIERINTLGAEELWVHTSPLWLRPQGGTKLKMYSPNGLIQVVGHTPMQKIRQERCFVSCDVFSTYRDGSQYGSNQFLLLDSVEKTFRGVDGPEVER